MSIADIIILTVVIAALAVALRYLKKHPQSDGCDGACASCGRKDGCSSAGDGGDRDTDGKIQM